ncbi:MAG: SGNH/GDSL hydrolase family protein [Bacteroidales bacterium]|nr:SGNH/GDSL hydrolase family protein [Bacteroidales bacterium]
MNDSEHKPGNTLSRRKFFRNTGLGAAAIAGMPILASSCSNGESQQKITEFFSAGDVILFQGDSITDAGRNRQRELPNDSGSFGGGYAHIIASWLLAEMAGKDLTIYNRGISGNKVYQLAERWDKDCLDLKPDVLSILIGVNDYWHFRNGQYDGTPEVYENDFRALLTRTREALPDIKLVICEPFVLTETSAVDESWLEPFRPYQEIAAKIAGEFDAVWVPFQEAFQKAIQLAPAAYWAGDGVHPSMAGAQLMADTWLKAL